MFANAWSFVVAWYNLPFTILLVVCALLAVLQLIGLGGEGESQDVDHDVELDQDLDLDHDVDIEHAVDLDHDADLDHAADVDHDADADHDADGAPTTLSVLAFIGLGKAPLLVVLLIFFGAIGILGWVLNSLVQGTLGSYPGVAFIVVLPLSVIVGGLISSRTSRFIGRALPPISTTATRAQALVGRRGTVVSPFVDDKYGLVRLRDSGGTLLSVFAVNQSGELIKRGSDVVLVAYDSTLKRYTVTNV